MEIDLDVNEDGTASSSVLMDMSGISDMMGGMMGTVPQEDQDESMNEMNLQYSKENICDTLMESQDEGEADQLSSFVPSEDSIRGSNIVNCVAIDDFVARLDYGEVDLVENGVLEIETTANIVRYTLTLSETEPQDQVDFSKKEEDNSLSFEEDDSSEVPDSVVSTPMNGEFPEMGVEMFEAMGMSMTMNISMPGKIVSISPNVGELNEEENVLTINLLRDSEELNENGLVLVSEKEISNGFVLDDSLIMIGGIGLLVVLIIAGALFVISKKKSKPGYVNSISKDDFGVKESQPKAESSWDSDLSNKKY